MKYLGIIHIAMILALSACGSPAEKPVSRVIESNTDTAETAMAEMETIVIQQGEPSYYEKNYKKIEENDLIGSKPLKKYLSDPDIPSKFKEILITDGDSLNSEDPSLALIDSIFSNDFDRHPFYFVLFTRSMWWADGAFAEPLYIAAKRYAETETATLLSFLTTEKVLTAADYSNWAEGIAMEISIHAEGAEADELENLRQIMLQNTASQEHDEVERFIRKVREFLL